MSLQPATKPASIVVVEDNDLNLKLVTALLGSGGYQYFTATNAEEGIQLIKTHIPDLVLMDIQLPGMDGLSATRVIKDDPSTTHIPVVALSAHAMEKDQLAAQTNGVAGYITKPFSTRTFLEKIAGYLPSTAPCTPSPSPTMLNRDRILVVDDEPLNLKLIEAILSDEKYEIKCLTSGKAALETATQFLPDLILLDVIMPDLNGFEVLKSIKTHPDLQSVPTVLITQLDSPKDKATGLEAGADDFLNKPLNAEELKVRVRSLLRMKRYKEQLDGRKSSTQRIFASPDPEDQQRYHSDLPVVLIAEDDERDAKLLNEHLSQFACRTVRVTSGQEALKKIKAEKPDIVLLDLLLPDLNGWRICRQIKDNEGTRNTQVAIITSLKDLDSRIRGIEAGTDDYLLKPIQPEEFRARLSALLKKKAYLDGLVDKMASAVKSSITDALTGLYTHGYLKHFLDLEVQRAERYKLSLALIMIDVDNFKQFNDTHGHLAGDSVLLTLAGLFRNAIRTTDLPARYGGEEFAIVLPYTDENSARNIAGRIQDAIVTHNATSRDKEPPLPSVSMGICIYPSPDAVNSEDLIEKADNALYAAKRDGKNCYRSTMDMSTHQGNIINMTKDGQ